ncbi:hypothetical protein MNBD_GAMMA03-189 [hydrothermal vent metagenome]|uniref:PIN domain-containing protein n=1 Tax=hydrothermal vent metagenome TaxID=652676 RepID=A0A3B0VR52_9ZZZZ
MDLNRRKHASSNISVAHETYRSIYDCLYLVGITKQINGKMVTADKKLYGVHTFTKT